MILYSGKQNGSNSISKGAYYDGDGSKNASAKKINSRCFKCDCHHSLTHHSLPEMAKSKSWKNLKFHSVKCKKTQLVPYCESTVQ